ncbi:MAG: GIY-YIG nuclease family protein [Bacteroidia bacterium]|nr:GIY-YIG nuclease family protein [Bacteroidia bacterium]
MYKVYVLYSVIKDKYYVGQTEDLPKRLNEHNIRRNLGTADWLIVYSESYETRTDAVRREREIKSKKSRKYIEGLIHNSNKSKD